MERTSGTPCARPPTLIPDAMGELLRVGASLTATADVPGILAGLADYAVRLGADVCWAGLVDESGAIVRPVTHRGGGGCLLATVEGTRRADGALAEPIAQALATGEMLVVDLDAADGAGPFVDEPRRRGHRAVAAVPLAFAGQSLGMVCVYSRRAGFFDAPTRHVLGVAGQIAAGALATAQALERADRSEGRFHDLLDHLPGVAHSMRPGWPAQFVFISGKVEEMLGYPPEAFYADGSLWTGCVHPDDRAFVAERGREALEGGEPFSLDYRLVHRDGREVRHVTSRVTPWRDATGRIALFQGITVDATEHKRLEQELLQAHRLAAVGQMAAMMAHEIRNPVAGMSLALRMLRDAGDDQALRAECMDDLGDCLHRINATLSRVLDFSKAKPLARRRCRLADVVAAAARLTATYVRKNDAALETDLAPDLPDLGADPDQLEQVFVNLILNACQAMPDGGRVAIRARAADGHLHAEVADDGIGILPEQREHIFDPFYSGSGRGTGLGLPLCRRIVEAHGGSITVDSDPAQGSTFRIDLPLEHAGGAHPGH